MNFLNLQFGKTPDEIFSIFCCRREFAAGHPARDLFQFQLRDFIGNPMLFDAADFGVVERNTAGDTTEIRYSGCSRLPETEVTAAIRADEAGKLHWNIRIIPGTKDFKVEWVDYPRLHLCEFPDAEYLIPYAEGTLISDLRRREAKASFPCALSDYPLTGVNSFYPGPAAMQFEAAYTADAGLCILCADSRHYPKVIDMIPDGDSIRLVLQHFTGGEDTLPYEVVTSAFSGDWQDAAEIYRSWMEANDPFLPPRLAGRMPRLLEDSPVVVAYPVKGRGVDSGGLTPNEYYPYTAALPVVDRYRETWQNPLLSLLMHWEGTAPWAPPFIWPPSGGEAMLAEYLEAMHRRGNFVGLYGSGVAWTRKSMIDPGYTLEERFETDQVGREICKGPRGEAFSRVCNNPKGQRLGYDLCAAREYTAAVVCGEVGPAAKLGVDYLQYFDQNQGCSAPLCYAKDHGHPGLPGAWETGAMRNLLARAKAAADKTVLGCENGAAEPYIGTCQLNDLRSHLAWGTGGMPVALYSYLFHEYTAGFSGNGVCLSAWVDTEHTPFYLLWSLAWNFASGNLLSVVLKDGGKIHWHWCIPWSAGEPEQEPVVTLVGNLSAWRRGAMKPYLVAGRMIKAPEVSCGTRRIFLTQQSPAAVPAVVVSAWESGGKRAVVLVNYGETAEPCKLQWRNPVNGTVSGAENVGPFYGKEVILTVPPLNAVLIESAV